MSIDEAFQRVIRGHWRLIAACLGLSVLAAIVYTQVQPLEYDAVGRIQLDSDLAVSNVQADAASTRVQGIATSRGAVEKALKEAGAHEDPNSFINNNIEVRRVGVSPVVEIIVTYQDPVKAAAIASSVTNQMLDFVNNGDRKSETDRATAVDANIAALTAQRDSLIPKLAVATPGQVLKLQAEITAIQATMDDQLKQRSDLAVAAAARPSAVLVDTVQTPATPNPRGRMQAAALAALLGLLGGLALAAGHEAVRPTLSSPEAISYALGAPVVGHVEADDVSGEAGDVFLSNIADRLALLGRRFGTDRVMLLPVRAADDALAEEVATGLDSGGKKQLAHRLPVSAMDGQWREPGPRPAAVVFAPRRMGAHELRPIQQLLASIDWPVLGVLTYDPPRPLKVATAPATAPVRGVA